MKDQIQAPPMQIMNMNQIQQQPMLNQQQQQQPMLNQQQQQKVIIVDNSHRNSEMMINHFPNRDSNRFHSRNCPLTDIPVSQSQGIGPPQMMNRGGGYGMWPPVDQLKFQNPMLPPPGFVSNPLSKPVGRNNIINNKNWKGKKGNDKRIRKDNPVIGSSGVSGNVGGGVGYKPPTLQDLQQQNRLKARRHFPKKKFNNNNNNNNYNYNRYAPYAHAPRNTSSFIIRAKKSGGITSLVSPCPVTPAVLPTPVFSPSREVLVDMAKEEWGVNGYGSMKGLIRLRSPGNEAEDEDDEEDGSSDSDVEEHVEVERRLDQDLSRFEMIYPNSGGAEHSTHYLLENRVDDQDTHIAQLEEENLILKERLFLMEREFDDLRRRLMCLERQNQTVEEANEEVVENESDDNESRGYGRYMDENNEEVVEENNDGSNFGEAKDAQDAEPKEANDVENNGDMLNNVGLEDVYMDENVRVEKEKNDENVEEKEDNDNGHLEAKQGSNDAVVEDKKEIIAEGLVNLEFRDVCMDEPGLVQDVVVVENLSNDEGVGRGEC